MQEQICIYSSDELFDEIKYQIRKQFGNQTKFAKEFGGTRKTVNRQLNHNRDWAAIMRMCELLEIKGCVKL